MKSKKAPADSEQFATSKQYQDFENQIYFCDFASNLTSRLKNKL